MQAVVDVNKIIPIIEPIALSIGDTAKATGESSWQVKEKIRTGRYKAKKSGRRTLVIFESVKDDFAGLPDWSDSTKQKTDKARSAALATLAQKRAAQREAARNKRKEAKRRTEQVTASE